MIALQTTAFVLLLASSLAGTPTVARQARRPADQDAEPQRLCRAASQRRARAEGRDHHRGDGVHRGRGHGLLADLPRVRRRDVEARRRARRADRRVRAQLLDTLTDEVADKLAGEGARPRGAAPGGQGQVLRAGQEGAVAADGAALPAGRAPVAAAHRPADLGVASDRQVTGAQT